MDSAVRDYIDAIPAERRPLFDRLHGLVVAAYPDVAVVLSYRMPTYVVGDHRLYVGVWRHGLSIYGWQEDHDAGLTTRHPGLTNGKGTIRLRPQDAAGITDDELIAFLRAALDA